MWFSFVWKNGPNDPNLWYYIISDREKKEDSVNLQEKSKFILWEKIDTVHRA